MGRQGEPVLSARLPTLVHCIRRTHRGKLFRHRCRLVPDYTMFVRRLFAENARDTPRTTELDREQSFLQTRC
jgi:hypothetical protein